MLGSIVARSPGCSLAASSLNSLEQVCRLWESASECVCGGKVLVRTSYVSGLGHEVTSDYYLLGYRQTIKTKGIHGVCPE